MARRLENAKADQQIAKNAIKSAELSVKAAKFASKAVPLAFAAWDVLDALKEYHEAVDSAGE